MFIVGFKTFQNNVFFSWFSLMNLWYDIYQGYLSFMENCKQNPRMKIPSKVYHLVLQATGCSNTTTQWR